MDAHRRQDGDDMPRITLPDGSARQFDGPVSGADVAASIGKGLARAALAIKVDGVLRRPRRHHRDRCLRRRRHQGFGRGAGAAAPRCGARSRRSGEGALPGDPDHHRAGDRERFLLRLRARAALHPGGSRADRNPDARDRGSRRADLARGVGSRRGDPGSSATGGRNTRRRSSRASRATNPSPCTARASGSISAAARTFPPPASSARRSS